MSMVCPVNIFIGSIPSFTAVGEYISDSCTIKKNHTHFGILLRILLHLYFLLSIFIVPLDIFFRGEYGSVVLPSTQQRRMHSCSSVCGSNFSTILSDIRVFGIPISLVDTFKASPACHFYRRRQT